MDGGYSPLRERSRPPLRLPNRSSSSLGAQRDPTHYPGSPVTHFSASPSLSSAHPAHQYHHASCARSGSSLPSYPASARQLSREGSMESTRQQPVSKFLQEKLQQERKAEYDKLGRSTAASRSHSETGGSIKSGSVSDKPSFGDKEQSEPRPQSGDGKQGQKKGMGLREMERNMSDLHKQNFNLKLEVSKRREKQVELESTLADLQSEKKHVDGLNDKLMNEVEKRDKAIQEAVSMIVLLEAKLEQLSSHNGNTLDSDDDSFKGFDNRVPRNPYLDIADTETDHKPMSRVPSFISERTDQTETLRTVYLNARSSVASLSPLTGRFSGGYNNPDIDLGSPTFSNLSQSSFPSVYGQKEDSRNDDRGSDELETLEGLDGSSTGPHARGSDDKGTNAWGVHRSNVTELQRTSASRPFQPMANVIGRQSPLQQIERLDHQYTRNESGHTVVQHGTPVIRQAHLQDSPSRRHTREQKGEASRQSLMNSHGGVRLYEPALPPTPDTMSTSTLRRMQNSDDTLAQNSEARSDQSKADSLGLLSDGPTQRILDPTRLTDHEATPTQAAGRLKLFTGGSYFGEQGDAALRARPAGSIAASRGKGNAWSSESEDGDTGGGGQSLASSDIWLQEGARSPTDDEQISPDLFGFPTNASRGGWSSDAMFGPNSVQPRGTFSGPTPDQMHDLYSANPTMFVTGPPPPPHRRSSLNAQTGSRSASPQGTIQVVSEVSPSRQTRPARRNSEVAQSRAGAQTPVQQPLRSPSQPGSGRKKSHYPPIAGQAGAARNGLNRIFRRPASASASDAAATDGQATLPSESAIHTSISGPLPPWVSAAAAEDDRSGATPPPINRYPRHMRVNSAAAAESYRPSTPDNGRASPVPPATAVPSGKPVPGLGDGNSRPPSVTGSRRKWLPSFGRSSSLRNRNA